MRSEILERAMGLGEALAAANTGGRSERSFLRTAGVGTNLGEAPKTSIRIVRAIAKEMGLDDPVHVGANFWMVVSVVTPLMAYRFLKERNLGNRDPTESQLAAIVRDIVSGNWVPNDQPISVGADGLIKNGQHRLWAILVAGLPVRVMFSFNISDDVVRIYDTQVRRTARHLITLFGDQSMTTHQEAVVTRAMFGMGRASRLSIAEKIAYVAAHQAEFEWLFRRFNKVVPRVTLAPVEAAVFRAYCSVSGGRRRLKQFADYIVEGNFEGYRKAKDGAVHDLRDWLLGSSPARANADHTTIYGTTALTIGHFLEENVPSKINCIDEDPFSNPQPVQSTEDPFSVSALIEQAEVKYGINRKDGIASEEEAEVEEVA